jgi:hypothetical protein
VARAVPGWMLQLCPSAYAWLCQFSAATCLPAPARHPVQPCVHTAAERMAKSADGFELTWAVNVLAPFLLTSLLIDKARHHHSRQPAHCHAANALGTAEAGAIWLQAHLRDLPAISLPTVHLPRVDSLPPVQPPGDKSGHHHKQHISIITPRHAQPSAGAWIQVGVDLVAMPGCTTDRQLFEQSSPNRQHLLQVGLPVPM